MIDYGQPPQPPLRPEDESWAAAIIAAASDPNSRIDRRKGNRLMNCQDHLYRNADPRQVSRRWFLEQCGVGLGSIALGQLLQADGYAAIARQVRGRQSAGAQGAASRGQGQAGVVSVHGGCAQPSGAVRLQAATGEVRRDAAAARAASRAIARRSSSPARSCSGPKFKFARHGQSGTELSELLPHLATVVDDIAVVKGMVTDAFNHAPGQIMMSTGSQIFGRPSVGAWVGYGLGSESQDLPGFVVFSTGNKGPSGGNSNWGNGFLPTVYQGVQFRTSGDPVLYLSNPRGVDLDLQRDSLETVNKLNRLRLGEVGDPEIATRINSYEMAFRMQLTRSRCDGHRPRAPAYSRSVRRRAGQAVVRQYVPAGAPAAGARGPVCADLS